jgi:hypothetical protein
MQNKEQHLEGVFVSGKKDGRTFLSGSINWAKAGILRLS